MNREWKVANVIVIATAGLIALGLYAARSRSSQIFGRSVWRGHGDRRSVALTFDDGPSALTPLLLKYLEQEQVRATFFQCGANIQRHPEIATAVHRAGHEIGNHTFSHRRLCPRLGWKWNILSPNEVFCEFARTQEILERLGIRPALLRAPYGLRWFGLRQAQRRLGLQGVMWTVIGHDWVWTEEAIVEAVLSRVVPGAIVCLHDGRDIRPDPDISATLRAVERIVPALKQQGYSFETVTSLLQRAGPA